MTQIMNQQILLKSRPLGSINPEENFHFIETPLQDLKDHEVSVRNIYLSLDPTHRIWISDKKQYMEPIQLGDVVRSFSVGKVYRSKHPDFQEGDIVTGLLGWQSYAHVKGDSLVKIPKPHPQPLSSVLSVFGLTGVTAYFGLLDIAHPQAGETVVVSAAAGAVGSIVGQIAKIKGCRVVGICGSKEKCTWLVDELGFDAAIDYKNESVEARLDAECPEGIDVYFENVGGPLLDMILKRINKFARISLCGFISSYNEEKLQPGPSYFPQILLQRAKIQGFIITDYAPRWHEAVKELQIWVNSGKIKYKEDIVQGIENAPKALTKLFNGANSGKLLVQVSEA